MAQFVQLKPRQDSSFTKRLSVFLYFFYALVFLTLFRFFYLQVVMGDYYYFLAEGNTEQRYPLIPTRGLIYDRHGEVLAQNKVSYNLAIIPAYLPRNKQERRKILEDISTQFSISLNHMISRLEYNLRSYRPILIKEDLSKKNLIFLEEHKQDYPFLSPIEYSTRIYPRGASYSHLLGYTGMIDQKELAQNKNKGYRRDVMIGKNGLERQYDLILRGIEGETVKIVNSLGRPLRDLIEKNLPAIPGKNIVTSIDARLQDLSYRLLFGRKGAIIVTRPSTGEVLTLVSSPGFNANYFANPDSRQSIISKILADPDKPFLNRAIQGRYPTGSTFKIVTAIAGLEDGKVNPYEKMQCRGSFNLGGRIFRDTKAHHGTNIFDALEHSCNVYFYQLGYDIGFASILEYATHLGLGRATGIDLPGEVSSFMPSPEWKERWFKEPWYDGDTVNASIGQGFITLTPLGMHNVISTVAAGRLFRPRVLWQIKNPYTGAVEKDFSSELLSSFALSQKSLDVLREGLARVPLSGTGIYHKHLSPVLIAGKTGSAQNVRSKTHSWFTAYGPIDKPLSEQYAVTVMVESSGHGGSIAVPISSMIFNYLEQKTEPEQALRIIENIFKYQERRSEASVQN